MKMKTFLLWTTAAFCLPHGGAGQEMLKTESRVPPTWTEVKPLLELVATQRVEYRADLGLAILRQAHSVIPEADAMVFMEDLFASAHTARYQTRFIYAARNRETSSEAIEANSLRIEAADALAIQSKVVEQMLKDSPEIAAQRFSEIHPIPQRATCADPTVQDLSSYYEALQTLSADPKVVAFNAEPRAQFLLDRFREAVTPEQIVPLLIVRSRIDSGPEDGQAELQFAAANLDRMTASGRELDALDTTLSRALQSLTTYAERRHLSLMNLALVYRSFLVRSATTPACGGDPQTRKYTYVNFNTFRSRLNQEAQSVVSALPPADVRTPDQGAPALDPQVSTLAGLPRALQQRLPNANNFYDFRSPTPTTEDDASTALATLTQAGLPGGCDLCLFQTHIRLFEVLTRRQSSGSPIRTLLLAEVKYLSQNPIEEQDPAAFLSPLKSLIETSRASAASANPNPMFPPGDRSKGYALPELSAEPDVLRQQLLLSNDPIISTYMQFETLFHVFYSPTAFVGPAVP